MRAAVFVGGEAGGDAGNGAVVAGLMGTPPQKRHLGEHRSVVGPLQGGGDDEPVGVAAQRDDGEHDAPCDVGSVAVACRILDHGAQGPRGADEVT